MKVDELRPGTMFLRKQNIEETLIKLDPKQYPDSDCILCINLSQPQALFGVLKDEEVFA